MFDVVRFVKRTHFQLSLMTGSYMVWGTWALGALNTCSLANLFLTRDIF